MKSRIYIDHLPESTKILITYQEVLEKINEIIKIINEMDLYKVEND